LVKAVKPPVQSLAPRDLRSAAPRCRVQRPAIVAAMPWVSTISLPARTWSAKPCAAWPAAWPCRTRAAVSSWLSRVTRISRPPPATASQPSIGWKMKIAAMNTGVQGMSISASTIGEARKACTESRSRSAGPPRRPATGCGAARSAAANSRPSSADWNRAASRAIARPRA